MLTLWPIKNPDSCGNRGKLRIILKIKTVEFHPLRSFYLEGRENIYSYGLDVKGIDMLFTHSGKTVFHFLEALMMRSFESVCMCLFGWFRELRSIYITVGHRFSRRQRERHHQG